MPHRAHIYVRLFPWDLPSFLSSHANECRAPRLEVSYGYVYDRTRPYFCFSSFSNDLEAT